MFFIGIFCLLEIRQQTFSSVWKKNAICIWRWNTNLWSSFQSCKTRSSSQFKTLKYFQYLLSWNPRRMAKPSTFKHISTVQWHGYSPLASMDGLLRSYRWWVFLRRKIMDTRMRPLIRPLFSCKIILFSSNRMTW